MFSVQTNARQCVIVFKAEEFGPGLFSSCPDKAGRGTWIFFFGGCAAEALASPVQTSHFFLRRWGAETPPGRHARCRMVMAAPRRARGDAGAV